MNKELADKLEGILDSASLEALVEELATICFQKAEHLRANWQDKDAARAWDRAGRKLDRMSVDRDIQEVP